MREELSNEALRLSGRHDDTATAAAALPQQLVLHARSSMVRLRATNLCWRPTSADDEADPPRVLLREELVESSREFSSPRSLAGRLGPGTAEPDSSDFEASTSVLLV